MKRKVNFIFYICANIMKAEHDRESLLSKIAEAHPVFVS